MAHIRYTEMDESPEIAAALANSIALRGKVGSLHRAMAHAPRLVVGFEKFSETIRKELPLGFDLFAIVTLRTVQALGDDYEWARCLPIALNNGIAIEKARSLQNWAGSDHFTDREKAALAIVDEHVLRRVDGEPSALKARAHLREDEIVSVCAVMGWFLFCGALTMPLGLFADDPAADLPVGIDDHRSAVEQEG